MKTIAFYGDSFCQSHRDDSWCVLLAEKLQSSITRFGIGGSSIWTTFIEFEKDQKNNNIADYLVFCWTDETRLYHPALPLTPNNKPIEGTDKNIWQAAEHYYKYLSFNDKDDIAYRYSLKYFDQNILKKHESNSNIIQMWSMLPKDFALTSGKFINESCLIHSWDGDTEAKVNPDINLTNHMTKEQNKTWAQKIYDNIDSRV